MQLLSEIRKRYHPLHHLRKVPLFQYMVERWDPIIAKRLSDLKHPIDVRLFAHASLLVSAEAIEPGVRKTFAACATPPRVDGFWDVGANIGLFTFAYATINLLETARPILLFESFEQGEECSRVLGEFDYRLFDSDKCSAVDADTSNFLALVPDRCAPDMLKRSLVSVTRCRAAVGRLGTRTQPRLLVHFSCQFSAFCFSLRRQPRFSLGRRAPKLEGRAPARPFYCATVASRSSALLRSAVSVPLFPP